MNNYKIEQLGTNIVIQQFLSHLKQCANHYNDTGVSYSRYLDFRNEYGTHSGYSFSSLNKIYGLRWNELILLAGLKTKSTFLSNTGGRPKKITVQIRCLRCDKFFGSPDRIKIRFCNKCKQNHF